MLLTCVGLLLSYLVAFIRDSALYRVVLSSLVLFVVLYCSAIALSCHVSVWACLVWSLLVVFCLRVSCIVADCCIGIVMCWIALPCRGFSRLVVLCCTVLTCLYYTYSIWYCLVFFRY